MDLQGHLRDVLDANRYLALGTTEDDGSPRVSPVFFTHVGHRTFYWVSSRESTHSRNVAARPAISFVVFDSSVEPGPDTAAVYVTARAEEVPDAELPAECERAFRNASDRGGRPFAPEELRGDELLRLYRARADSHAVHIRGSHPELGSGIDRRVEVDLPDLPS